MYEIIIFTDTEEVAKPVDCNGREYWQFVLGYYQTWVYKKGRAHSMIEAGYYNHPRDFHVIMAREAQFFRKPEIAYNVTVIAHNWNFDGSELGIGSKKYKKEFGYDVNMSKGIQYDPIINGRLPYFLELDWPKTAELRPTRLFAKKEITCKFNILDSTNFFPGTPLEELGEAIGYPKAKLPDLTYEEYIADPQRCREAMKERVTKDVEILSKTYRQLCEFTIKNFKTVPIMTIGRLATSSFANSKEYNESLKIKSIKGKQSIDVARPVAPSDPLAIAVICNTYKGARTECFYKGKPYTAKTLYKYDINSMYPYLMKTLSVPTKFIGSLDNPRKLKEVINKINKASKYSHTYLARVDINIKNLPENFYGFEGVPIDKKGLCFPVGRMNDMWLWKEQYEYALQRGWICNKRPKELHVYECHKIFADYIDRLYEMRMEYKKAGNKIFEKFCKLMMNSLYGRFGMKASGQWEVCKDEVFLKRYGEDDRYNTRTTNIHSGSEDDNRHYHLCDDGIWYEFIPASQIYNKNSVPQIAHYITAMGRLMLTKTFYDIMDRGGHVYYCDTDSMIIDIEIEHSKELGGWKLEEISNPEDCFFYAPKHYIFNKKATIKGVTFNKEVPVNDTDLCFIQKRWSRHMQLLKKGQVDKGGYRETYVKVLSGENVKRKNCGFCEFTMPLIHYNKSSEVC